MNGNRADRARVGMVEGEMTPPLTHLFKAEPFQSSHDPSACHRGNLGNFDPCLCCRDVRLCRDFEHQNLAQAFGVKPHHSAIRRHALA